ncbi:MAG: hypothetical protein ACI9UT_003505, partial [Flavobacteriales bacterium]
AFKVSAENSLFLGQIASGRHAGRWREAYFFIFTNSKHRY